MTRGELVPVTRRITVPVTNASQAVQRFAGERPIVGVVEDHEHPYQPGDPVVSAYVTTLESPRRQHPWHLYLRLAICLVLACALLAAILIDVHLVVGAFVLSCFVALAWLFDRNDRRKTS